MSTRPAVPVTTGSPRSRTRVLDAFTVVHAWFPPDTTIESHTHDYPVLAVMVGGSFDLQLARQWHHCPAASVLVEPAGEPHGNRMHRAGADVIIVQPHPASAERWLPFQRLFAEPVQTRHGGIRALAARLAHEVPSDNPVARLAVEAIALEMLVIAARLDTPRSKGAAPSWLRRVADAIHEQPAASLNMAALAGIAGVSPGHLARVFRQTYRTSVGSYARQVRLEWAIQRLAQSSESIAAVAVRAGFADQSHLTRAMKAHLGMTPARFRGSLPSR